MFIVYINSYLLCLYTINNNIRIIQHTLATSKGDMVSLEIVFFPININLFLHLITQSQNNERNLFLNAWFIDSEVSILQPGCHDWTCTRPRSLCSRHHTTG